ncbi:MAG TPA: NAD(P)/FAD-dependent oxidoreductase [Candidatus Lachnoclostridium stercorigallinarum]|uniref:NAD(P)/FAD-dependent oxidoreductase n=1 Tax=Candidatus Lachnoclostridium stercorigallinarum TaxID=2838634 RepID=A0A9D2GH24_9FIRM|nr:NAD(P)/FAD-dependent oxidoreductase [Candidatus Lachnoclostridium stercorigallinarum]
MNHQFPTLFSPYKIGNVEIKNRICKAPQTTGLSHMDGTVSSRLVRCYEDLAKGEVGMIIVEYAFVDRDCSKSASNQLGICDDEYIVGLGWLADTIKNNDCVPCIQIEHCGRQRFLGPPMKSASPNPWPLMYERYGQAAIPEELTIEEIHQLIEDFGRAALRAKTAGFQVVEIHGAHGYLITNFLSPFTNQRKDWYGGSRENRFRFLEQVFKRCREYVGEDFPIIVRLSGTDYEPGGMTIEDTIYYAKRLEELGCAAIDVSGGDHHQMIHQVSPMQIPRGHNVWAAEAIKKEVNIPVFATGSITQPQFAEEILASGKADFISMGRPLLADPYWAKKAMEGHPEDISPCIRCNEGCLDRGNHLGKSINCTMNPLLGFEDALALRPAEHPEKIAVVGGGPAGMKAADAAALRGHQVSLFEKRKLGGYLHEASYPEFKADIRDALNYLVTQVRKHGVTIVEKEAKLEDLTDFDAVIVAAGASPVGLKVPGADRPNVTLAVDVLCGEAEKPSGKIVVIGGGMIGTETAVLFGQNPDNQVTIIEMLPQIMKGCSDSDRTVYGEMIREHHIQVFTSSRVTEITDEGVVMEQNGRRRLIPADHVFLATGMRPNRDLYDSLKAQGRRVYNVGDSLELGKIYDAIHTGYKAGWKI